MGDWFGVLAVACAGFYAGGFMLAGAAWRRMAAAAVVLAVLVFGSAGALPGFAAGVVIACAWRYFATDKRS